jgi:hypothetical protein
MKLLINNKNEIESYSIWGDIEGAIEYTGMIPDDFFSKFKPYVYLIQDNNIVDNPDYVAPTPDTIGPSSVQQIIMQMSATMTQMQQLIMAQGQEIAELKGADK